MPSELRREFKRGYPSYIEAQDISDGTLIGGAGDGGIWFVHGGAKFHVPNMPTLNRLFPEVPVRDVSRRVLDGIADIPRDGTLLNEGHDAIWVVFNNAKFQIPSMPVFDLLFAGQPVRELWDDALTNIPDVPGDGSLLSEGSYAIWVVYGGAKFQVPNPSILDALYGASRGPDLWENALSGLSAIPRDGTLLREQSSLLTYIITGGHKQPAPANARGPVALLWNGALDQIP